MNFIRIETFYSNEIERTISHLSKLYDNKILLKKKILMAGKGVLDNPSIIEGKKILIKPNWVTHNRKTDDKICLRTHDMFLVSTLEILLENKPKSIIIGDAPIQDCGWEMLISNQLLKSIAYLSQIHSIPIVIKDFRRVTFDHKRNNPIKDRNPISDYIIFNLGKESYLEPISSMDPIFRVTKYNPDRLSEAHTLGKHKYCIAKELFETDIVLSLPKIKTHQKTGITGALKNIVGLNGDKDYLPHHRIGGDQIGGDCYPGKSYLRFTAEKALDIANRYQGKRLYWIWYWLAAVLWRLSFPKKVHNLAAGWYGNDTCWRMVMDLNKIAVFGNKDGTLSEKPQRIIYSLCDGLVGGQGDGPLNPNPLPLGVISLSNNSSLNDYCMTILMGFDPNKIPFLLNANINVQTQENEIFLNGRKVNFLNLLSHSIPTIPPPGWIEYLT